MDDIIATWSFGLVLALTCAAICTIYEVVFTADRTVIARARGVRFGTVTSFGATVAGVLSLAIVRAIGIPPLLDIDLIQLAGEPGSWTRYLLLLPLALIPQFVGDIAFYWGHRIMHAVPFLWHFHKTHHAIENLNAANSYVHWTEGFIKLPLNYIPLALLVQWTYSEIMLVTLIYGSFWAAFIHSKIDTDLGAFGRFFVSPRFHRTHHSRDARHFDKNFAGNFSVIDVIFGTACFPSKGEKLTTGVSDKVEATTATQYLLSSLRDRPDNPSAKSTVIASTLTATFERAISPK
jgi:sterol desaturase/sphingolipid hydroxylase (fatty acid hydroxylase superfamily)